MKTSLSFPYLFFMPFSPLRLHRPIVSFSSLGYRYGMSNEHHDLPRLYPDLDDTQLAEAAETLDRYASLTLRIAERIANDVEALERLRFLTKPAPPLTLEDKGRTLTSPPSS